MKIMISSYVHLCNSTNVNAVESSQVGLSLLWGMADKIVLSSKLSLGPKSSLHSKKYPGTLPVIIDDNLYQKYYVR